MLKQPVWEEAFDQEGFTLVRVDYPAGLVQCGHAHDYASVTLILAGEVIETVGSETVVGHPLSVVIKRPGVKHACRWGPNGARVLSLEIDPGVLGQLQLGGEDPASAWHWFAHGQGVAELVGLHRATDEESGREAIQDLAVELFGALVAPGADDRGPAPPWIAPALDEIRESSPNRPSTHLLAASAGVHPVHFARVFRRHVGVSPTGFARWLRLRRVASELATSPDSSVGRVAHRRGFADHSHLCREFRGSLHLTPTDFRSLATPVRRG